MYIKTLIDTVDILQKTNLLPHHTRSNKAPTQEIVFNAQVNLP
jgi:hypothetical protein